MPMVLVTGTAGFIGFHVAARLLQEGLAVFGIDNLNDYYDPALKRARLERLSEHRNFTFELCDIAGTGAVNEVFQKQEFDAVVNLAAQAGVRYSLTNPHAYVDSNVKGFLNILEGCRHSGIGHLVFASSSSVYGANASMPYSVGDNVDHPVSLYAATKKSNELMAHAYAHLYGIPCTGLRFFTVYGPWGRPDMAYFTFTKSIFEGTPIKVFNYGHHKRDFTYIDDIVDGIVRVIGHIPQPNPNWSGLEPDPGSSSAPYRLYNIGNNQPVELMYMIEVLEGLIDKAACTEFLPKQPGDVDETYADITELSHDVGFSPKTSIEEGLEQFVSWYRQYYVD